MESPSENSIPSDRRVPRMRAAAVGLCALVALLATSPKLPIVWDEGNAISRAERIENWGRSWFPQGPPDQNHPMSRQAVADGWPYTTQVEGHPAFYGIVIAAGHSIGRHFLTTLDAWRLGPILLFAAAAGAMFYRLSRDYGQAAGLAAVLALLLQPRLFAHAHFATCDGPLTACWVLAWVVFCARSAPLPSPPPRCAGEGILFGVFLGMTMSTKATGWIAPVPFVLWAAVYRDRVAAVRLAIGLPVALATFYVLNPPLWHDPIHGLATFLQLNTNRQLNIANFFLGRMYDLHHSLPWYNTLVWTAISVPVGLLVLAIVGVGSVLRRGIGDRVGILLMFNWLILLIVRALPGTPPHDGIRLFLPAFAFLAAFIGIGSAYILGCHWRLASARDETAGKPTTLNDPPTACTPITDGNETPACATACLPSSAQRCVLTIIVLIFLGSTTSLFYYAPQWLSYYNLVIGGLPGATRAGMEPTYYWDSLDDEVLDWLAANTNENEKVLFGSGSDENLALMHTWGTLPVEHRPDAPGRYRWYVIQRRPSACMPPDQWLLKNAEPVYKKYLHPYGYGPWRMNVPLLEVYRYEDYEAAVAQTKSAR